MRRYSSVLSAALVLAGLVSAQPTGQKITHGPMLGRPGATQMGIWARTAQPGKFRVLYGTAADRLDRASPEAVTNLERDNTGYVVLQGLSPSTLYHYRAVVGDAKEGPGGTFRTFPDAAAFRNDRVNPRGLFNFSFEFGCGNNQGPHGNGPTTPAFKVMLEQLREKIHFAILNGDWLYEDGRNYSPQQWLKEVGRIEKDLPEIVRLAPGITGVWRNYKLYLERSQNLATWHRNIPNWYTLDDHEILNDVNGCGEIGYRNRRAVFRDPALRAWFDYIGWSNPTHFQQEAHFGRTQLQGGKAVLVDPQADFTKLDLKQLATLHVHWGTPDAGVDDPKLDVQGGDPNAGVYEIVQVVDRHTLKIRPAPKQNGAANYSIGRRTYCKTRVANCDFYLLDTRSHRMRHDFKNPQKPGISMIGKEQRAWLLDSMAKSDADFFFVVSSVNFMIPHNGAGGMAFQAPDKDDAWTAFLHERELLIPAWEKLKRPVFVLTGDLHNSFAVKVTDTIWEFASGPHNSRNHNAGSEGDRPANGPYRWGPRGCDIRWSSYFRDDVPSSLRLRPVYCVVQINNVFNNPLLADEARWVAFPRPQAVFRYHDGRTGDLLYAEAIRGGKE